MKLKFQSIATFCLLIALAGCQSAPHPVPGIIPPPNDDGNERATLAEQVGIHKRELLLPPLPTELNKVCLPDYKVEPPDILLIEAVRAIPKPPYKAEPLDILYINLTSPLIPNEPLNGLVTVDPEGNINLGAFYGGNISVVSKTIPEIKAAIENHLANTVGLKDPKVNVSLSQGRAAQRISGQHLIRPDGTLSLGTYGSVRVVGMTLPEVRAALEAHLDNFLLKPQISVDVLSFNSKLYYVILDGGGSGQTIVRLPITGNDTVLDAIAQAKGLSAVSSKDRIWVSRPAPAGGSHQVLPVDWRSVVQLGDTATNYQILPGDRIYIAAYPVVTLNNYLTRVIAPLNQIFGGVLLGNSTVQSFSYQNGGGIGGGIP